MRRTNAESACDMVEKNMEPTCDMAEPNAEPTSEMVETNMEPTGDMAEPNAEPTSEMVEKNMEPTGDMAEPNVESTSEMVETNMESSYDMSNQYKGHSCDTSQGKLEFPCDMKKTKQREDVFRVLSESALPLSAMDIYEKLREEITYPNEKKTNEEISNKKISNDKSVYAVSTIYRTLQAFEKHNLVEKSTLAGSDMAVYTLKTKEHTHYAICLKCHKMVPIKECPYEHMHFEEEEFTVTNHKIEVYGYCKKCGENVN